MDLKDKVAIVTGGARGIGEAIAATFAREGAKVVIGDRLEAEAGETVERIRQAGGTADFLRTDVSSRTEMEALVGAAVRQHGRVDILVNNAGALGIARLLDTSDDL